MLRSLSTAAAVALPTLLSAGYFGPVLKPELGTFPAECCAIHLIHVNGGDFLMWGNSVGGTMTKSWTWNAFTGQHSEIMPRINEDTFCCGVSQLPDGRAIIAGGNMGEAYGINKTYIYNPVTRKWFVSATDDLSENRWYPTLAALADGTITAISGWDVPPIDPDPAIWNERIDVRNPITGIWTDFMPTFHPLVGSLPIQPHFYPFMFAYYDAAEPTKRKLFFAGKSTVDMDGFLWTLASFSLSFSSDSAAEWKPLGGDSGMQGAGAVMMISRTDPIDVGTVYKFGGRQGTSVL
jgi:hypothetical protein